MHLGVDRLSLYVDGALIQDLRRRTMKRLRVDVNASMNVHVRFLPPLPASPISPSRVNVNYVGVDGV